MEDRKRQVNIIFICFVVVLSVVVSKAFYIQVLNKDDLIAYSKSQFFRISKIYPNRGNIYDRNGSSLAINIKTFSVFTIPKNIKNKKRVYRKLAKIIRHLNYRQIMAKVKGRKRYTWIARKISLNDDQVQRIKQLDGVYLEAVPKRIYPNHELLSQALGFVGVDNIGLAGVEYLFDQKLRGKPKIWKYIQDAKGRALKFESKSSPGGESEDIFLSIDKDLQAVAEKHLKAAVLGHKAEKGGVGIIDARNGEILAMANYPTYDPNIVKQSKAENRKLSFVTDPFEPGSTFKTFTIAAALESKIAQPDTNYYCERGRLKVENHIIKEAMGDKKFEWLSLREILQFSSNVGVTKIAFDLTYPKLKRSLDMLRIGKKTGVELPGESRGIFTNSENISPLSLSNISFGQGVAVTGMQMLAAYSAIVNDGYYIKPTIIKRKSGEKIERTRIFSRDTTKKTVSMLIDAVEKGTGGNARIPYFVIAGKTGTAQRPDNDGGYSGYVPSFIGFPVNVDSPFIIYVYLDNPKGKGYYGNVSAAPVFRKIAQYLLYKDKNFISLAVGKGRKRVRDTVDTVQVQHSSARIIGKKAVPNFVGLDKSSAQRLAVKTGLTVSTKGFGVVASQRPKAFSRRGKQSNVHLKFQTPQYD
ncbi:MAG: PASTA domain-containing protein [Bdellovibrionales bacterium]|jgi:cell division protein FtsI (penicillin-binding protein 3)|nr:PASTA domain-containing protein [Bdellovibrionales bacterium]MBT3526043.1 PASTA domain-containing protein [Bdellovibrionales bacterium]MBT7668695.1 PASTA domain-containing protein [Bdellovibrionales bacterium]